MNKIATLFSACCLASASIGQTDVTLNITHEFGGQAFAYNQTYTTSSGLAVSFDRVQYYLSGINIVHDGGQSTQLSDPYVLASGNVSSYVLGSENVTNVEGLDFDLGVDANANSMGLSSWPNGHPLAAQSPSMDWGWPSGYFFFVIDGKADQDGDGTPEKTFQYRGLGQTLLRNVNQVSTTASASGGAVTVQMYCDIADWVMDMDMVNDGVLHNASAQNINVADNTNTYSVFSGSSSVSTGKEIEREANVNIDYQLPYAPTIFYDMVSNEKVDLKIYDIKGQMVISQNGMSGSGNYFITKELESGTYIATLSNGSVSKSVKILVQR